MTECPKCNYERKPNSTECPRCGVVYEKYENYVNKKRMEQESEKSKEINNKNESFNDLCSANIIVKGSMSKIEVKNGELHIKSWSNEKTVIRLEEISGVNLAEPGMLTSGYLHIATFTNPAPPNSVFSANAQCLIFEKKHASAVQKLFLAIQSYLNENPPAARHPKGEARAENAMKLDLLPQKTRKVYDEQVGAHDVQFVVMGLKGQAIIALSERLVVVKAGFMAGATGGGRATSFRYEDIIGLEINTGWVTAVIEIITAGHTGTPQHDYWALGKDRDPWKLSNTLPLTKELLEEQKDNIQELRALIDTAKTHITSTMPSAGNITTQLRELSELHEKGLLSSEEFAQAKKKLLGVDT